MVPIGTHLEKTERPSGEVTDAVIYFLARMDKLARNYFPFNLGWGDHLPWQNGHIYWHFSDSRRSVRLFGNTEVAIVGLSFSVTDGEQVVYKNGKSILSGPRTQPTSISGDGLFFFPGNVAGNRFGSDWSFGEMLVIDGLLSKDNRQKIEGYLAHKWGMLAKLPAEHPYIVDYPQSTNLGNQSATPSYVPAFGIQMLSNDAGFPGWTTLDPSKPLQNKSYHLSFDGNLSDELNPLSFYKFGSSEKLYLSNMAPSMEMSSPVGKVYLEGNQTVIEREWFNLFGQVDYDEEVVDLYLNGMPVGTTEFTPNSSIDESVVSQWIFAQTSLSLGIDELRISDQIRSSGWILAEHANLNADFPRVSGEVSGKPSFTSAETFQIAAGKYFETQISATGNPIAFLASGLPGGLTINPADGNLSGTPVRAGTYFTDLTAFYYENGKEDTATDRIQITVDPSPPTILVHSALGDGKTSIEVDYEISSTGGEDPEVFLFADLVDHGKDLHAWEYRMQLGTKGFGPASITLGGLDTEKRYFVRMYARNVAGESWTGKETIIKTQPQLEDLPRTLFLWFDANDLLGENKTNPPVFDDGYPVDQWKNKIQKTSDPFANDKHLNKPNSDILSNDPKIRRLGEDGLQVVEFDGNDKLQNEFEIGSALNSSIDDWERSGFSLFCVSRYNGIYNDKLVYSSNNWFIGHASNGIGKYYFNGWVDQGFDSDQNFHIFEVSHEGINPISLNDPICRVWNDAVTGSYFNGSPQGSEETDYKFLPKNIIFGGGAGQIGEFLLFIGELEEDERTTLEGYLSHKWGIPLPSAHPWYLQTPVFGEIVTSGITHVGSTGTSLAPVAINHSPANLTKNSATLTGQLINAGLGYPSDNAFSPKDYPGLKLWLDANFTDKIDLSFSDESGTGASGYLLWHNRSSPPVFETVILNGGQGYSTASTKVNLSNQRDQELLEKYLPGFDPPTMLSVEISNESRILGVSLVKTFDHLFRLVDHSSNNNDATQNSTSNLPSFLSVGGMTYLDFNESDFLNFTSTVDDIRTIFLVTKREEGNRGHLLGHDPRPAFYPGLESIWDMDNLTTNVFLTNGIFRENGNLKNAATDDYAQGETVVISLVTDGVVQASNFSRDLGSNTYWHGLLGEVLIYNTVLSDAQVRLAEGYLAHKWGLKDQLMLTHPYRSLNPVKTDSSAQVTIYWGGNDGGDNAAIWQNQFTIEGVKLGLRKLRAGEVVVLAEPEPNDLGRTYGASKLLDGKLPNDGWRSSWTAWYGTDPQLTFSFDRKRPVETIRIYYQPFARADELDQLDIYIADDELNFALHKQVNGIISLREQGGFFEVEMGGVHTKAVRLLPKHRGWGHQWGEVEFWIQDDGRFEEKITGLAPGETYFYRAFASNEGGSYWSPNTEFFTAEENVKYDNGLLLINTTLGTWTHTNGDNRVGEVSESSFIDNFGNSHSLKICEFKFDQLDLSGKLQVEINGDASLLLSIGKDAYIGVPLLLNGGSGENAKPNNPGPGGFAGGMVGERGQGPGGGLSGTTQGGAGHGGTGARSTVNSGRPYGDSRISNLIGGSGGGGYIVDHAGGSGGGAIGIETNGTLKIESIIETIGGAGITGSAGGSGGSIRLSADILLVSENGRLDASGGANGGAGGRIYLKGRSLLENKGENNILAIGGGGASPGGPGTVNFNRPIKSENLQHFNGTLRIDTTDGTITHSDGSVYFGIIEEQNYRHSDGMVWSYSICRFVFEEIHLGGSLIIETSGKNSLLLEAASGDFTLDTNLIADGGHTNAENQTGGLGRLGGYSGSRAGPRVGNGPGASAEISTSGHGAAYGGDGSGTAQAYGDFLISDLLGGSSGGSGSSSGSGAGGGAIWLKSAGKLKIHPNTLLSANGGNGRQFSAAGSGGAIRLEAQEVINEGKIEAKSGSGIRKFGKDQNRGSGGGRISIISEQRAIVGEIDISGESSLQQGTLSISGSYDAGNLILESGKITFNTKTGCFYTSEGAYGTGIFSEQSTLTESGETWNWETCTFEFGHVDLGPEVSVELLGNKPLIIKTVAGGDIKISTDMILDGEDASLLNGFGGVGRLNPMEWGQCTIC